MTIGIIGAMDEEIAVLLANMTNKEEDIIGNTSYIQGRMAGKDIILLKSGIGKVNAAMATTIMHERYSPSHVINTGSAGGLSKEMAVGDIVISSEVVHHDVDATAFNYTYGQVPGMPKTFLADDYLISKVMAAVKKLGINYSKGMIGTGDSFMADPSSVLFIKQKFPMLIAAEMEATAIAQVCYQYNKPFVVIRALSDIAGVESSISFDTFLKKAAKNASELIIEFVKTI